MSDKLRPIIAVAAAEANNSEQRQVIRGIVEQAQACNADVAVISNVFNSGDSSDEKYTENEIYELLLSDDIDGIIFISESFVNDELKKKLNSLFMKRRGLPVLAVGTTIPEMAESTPYCINTDDQSDIEALTDHLIDDHGFRSIDMITGYDHIEASHSRVRGYRASLEKHGIPYDENRVIFGNFWMNSGEELAEKYISGERPMPEAVVCANDYMAYGLLDKFMENDIPVPQAITVVGYEYVWKRIYHHPLLTTYQRNRTELGRKAVQIIFRLMAGETELDFSPPCGMLIRGESCPCQAHSGHYITELNSVKDENMYSEWNITSPMDRQLTNCANVDEFADVMGKNSFLVRYVQDIFLCLSEKWYDDSTEQDIMSCRSVLPWLDTTPFLIHKYNFSRIFARNTAPAVYYFSPLFFADKTFGYTVLKYDKPDTYDIIYKNWIKSLSNALEFMRMKNDIRYFTAYDNLSEQYDSLTGIYNAKGFGDALKYAAKNASDSEKAVLIMLKLLPPDDSLDILSTQLSVHSEIADCLRMLTSDGSGLCGRIDRNLYTFALVGDTEQEYAELLLDKLRLLVMYRTSCVREWGLHSFAAAVKCLDTADIDRSDIIADMKLEIAAAEREQSEKKLIPGFTKFLKFRSDIYMSPGEEHSIDRICRGFGFSEGHFRKLYKDCFGVSFHQDHLNSRIDHAKYLICTTACDTAAISSACGYVDTKYFMRIFRSSTGMTVKQYREKFR